MLLVKAKSGPSPIAGMGLFADQKIPKGTVVWKFSSTIDEAYSFEEASKLPEPKRSEILGLHHAYINKQTGEYINCGDEAKYINHSLNPNVGVRYDSGEELNFALSDIDLGEEVTINYSEFSKEGVDF